MKNPIKLLVILCVCFLSCVNENKKNQKLDLISKIESENCMFSPNLKTTQVIWNGYKTTDKIKVTGQFNKFKSAKIHKNSHSEF